MRWYILKALLVKEWQRHLANRMGVALALLLVAAAVLLSVFAPGGESTAAGTEAVGGVRHCFVEYDRLTPVIQHLEENRPPELKEQIRFRPLADADKLDGVIVYPTGTASIQIRHVFADKAPNGRDTLSVYVWHPDGDPTALAPYETWLWKEVRRFYARRARDKGVTPPPDPAFDAENQWLLTEAHRRFQEQIAAAPGNTGGVFAVPDLDVTRKGLGGKVLDIRSAVATALIIFSLYFTCVYLLPTLNCEERERGVLLAQALSPASPAEIVAAKFLFYPTAGVLLAVAITAVYKTALLSSLFFWLSLFAVGGGFLGIGMTIATLARTQKAAFLGGMCYLMTVAMVLLICSMNSIPVLPYLAVEYHGPRILHAAITGEV
ncbi:MAG TPA: ABC transporter permease, partial [Gemmata sp.]|nr:ABC transporter permease [Gemmata sp.]